MTGRAGNDNLYRAQRRRLARFAVKECVDIHCHCLPGLDDGPATMVDALALCRALIADGITTVIATPHQLGRYDGRNSPADIRSAVASLNASLLTEDLPIGVVPGADVRIDERIPRLIEQDEVMTLADTRRSLLLELPHETYINPLPTLQELQPAGVSVILTHPERSDYLAKSPAVVLPWLEKGLALQITAGSLIGQFGSLAERACWYWLAAGAVSLVATDAHDAVTRRPCMSEAIAAISSRLGAAAARRVCIENPLRVLEGLEINAIPDLAERP